MSRNGVTVIVTEALIDVLPGRLNATTGDNEAVVANTADVPAVSTAVDTEVPVTALSARLTDAEVAPVLPPPPVTAALTETPAGFVTVMPNCGRDVSVMSVSEVPTLVPKRRATSNASPARIVVWDSRPVEGNATTDDSLACAGAVMTNSDEIKATMAPSARP
jgi:hypothetical protein